MLVTSDTLTHGGTDGDSNVYIIIIYTHNIMCVYVCTCRTEQVTIIHMHIIQMLKIHIIIHHTFTCINITYTFSCKTSASVCHCRNSVLEL